MSVGNQQMFYKPELQVSFEYFNVYKFQEKKLNNLYYPLKDIILHQNNTRPQHGQW